MSIITKNVLFFAAKCHAGQFRDDGTDYIIHPIRAASILRQHGVKEDDILAAAYCHDILEDCPLVSAQELLDKIGVDAYNLVVELTCPDNGNFSSKFLNLYDKCGKMSDGAKLIKLADRLDNIRDSLNCYNLRIPLWPIKRVLRYAGQGVELSKILVGDGNFSRERRNLAEEIDTMYGMVKLAKDPSYVQ